MLGTWCLSVNDTVFKFVNLIDQKSHLLELLSKVKFVYTLLWIYLYYIYIYIYINLYM